MLKNQDGTPYRPRGSLTQFDPEQKAHCLFDRYDEEVIRLGGSPIFYHEILIQFQTVDPLYLEDRGRLFSPVPVQLFAVYDPPMQQNLSGMFGNDTPNDEIILEMNYKAVLRAIGHPPKMGSRIYTPHRAENWQIVEMRLDQFKLWGALHLQLQCRKYQETSTADNGKQDVQDFKVTDMNCPT